MKYSIIIPTLNEEKLLPDLLNSLCSEEFKKKYEYEVIVSDGGSTDVTINIAERYADKTIYIDKNQKQNISLGRHLGSVNAEGEILIFINADVRFDNLKNFFETLNRFANINRYAAMTCNVKVFPEFETVSDKLFSAFINFYVRVLNLIGIGMARGECQVIRKNIYNEIGGYNTALFAGEDFELSTRLRKKGKIYFAPDIVIYESPRRYHKWGYYKIISSWFFNSMSSWFLKKSVSKKWEPVR